MTLFKKIILLVFMAGIVASCDNVVDVDQPGVLNADAAYQTVGDLEQGLLGVYAQLDVSSEIRFNASFTDEVSIGIENGGQDVGGLYNFVLNSGTPGPEAIWTTNYDAINAATRLIAAAENIEPSGDYNSILGQAYAIRAFAHMKLMTYFAEDMTDNSSLGVIAVSEVPEITDAPERSTTGEVYTLISNDLSEAESLIPSSLSETTRFTQDAITAMRARIAAYRGNYGTAETESQELIDKYDLADQQEYLSMFRNDTDGEVIFKLDRTVGDPYDGQGTTANATAGGWAGAVFAFTGPDIAGAPYLEMGRTLYNLLDQADIRYDVNVSSSSQFDSGYPNNTTAESFSNNDIIPIDKYRGSVPGENQPLMNDLKIFRVSEMLLINAEAEVAENGDLAEAATLIKQLRDARYGSAQPLPTYNSEQEAYADILEERRRELAFEGHRWVDLGRLGVRANAGIDREELDCTLYGACQGAPVPGNDHRYRFPIPLVELNGNSEITQNPEY
jgi:hypothetical protein